MSSAAFDGKFITVDDIIRNHNKTYEYQIRFTIGFAVLLLVLTALSIVGVFLAALIRRKKEFGIRFAAGSTMKQLIILVYGEMLLLIATAALAGLIVVTLASSLIDINLRIDGVTVLVILGIMTALSGICLIPLTFQMKRYMPTDMLRGV
ncbi:hypothetical protein LQV63_29095 [Paenibacillus profundus]|uniref:ABC3 transporter permease C-terminal domain-containing protein n=1 Tax=Paenibacillus profundus TaxID=1173085 RepID=A0ABS8YNB5_9BACL|nr:FtsX-like permease family protein [Paenibacillus profundus]MCE5173313.1 hypothetical protein [Paenibacillus profundus]